MPSVHGGVVNDPSDGSERVVANHLGVCVVPPFGRLTGFIREGDIYDPEAGVANATVELSSGQSATSPSAASPSWRGLTRDSPLGRRA